MIEINGKLHKEILEYCKTNNIEDVNSFINECVRDGFSVKKYGSQPLFVAPPIEPEPNKTEETKQTEIKINNSDDYSIYDVN